MSYIRGTVLLAGFLTLSLTAIPFQWIALKTGAQVSRRIPVFYHRTLCRLLGIRIKTYGVPAVEGAALVAANHTSWLDIPILGASVEGSFVAKSEVDEWPFFNLLARLQRTVYVERQRRLQTAEHRDRIYRRLAEGDTLILFPEGTSSDGNSVLPFKSALMSVAQLDVPGPNGPQRIPVQPVSVAYTRLHGLPMGRQYRPFFAWYGDMDLVPHLWEAFCMGPIDVDIHYHPPVTFDDFGSRKTLTTHCHRAISEGVAHSLCGRPELVAKAGAVLEDEGEQVAGHAGVRAGASPS